jgi:hypothetical protein
VVRLLLPLALLATAGAQTRAIVSVLPSLEYSRACTSSIELRNLGERSVRVEVEGHRGTGALVPLSGHAGLSIELPPLESLTFKLAVEGETDTGWVKVRESVPSGSSPVVAVQGTTECVAGDQLRSVVRDVAFPTASPWFSGDVADLSGSEISLINTSESAVTADGCYSAGSLFSNPGRGASSELVPVCSDSFHVQIPPFGTRRFPVKRENSSHFAVKTQGRGIVLQMLRPVDASVRLYKVDSTIQFGSEVPASPPK